MLVIGLKPIVKMFDKGNVSVSGLRGRGKDILTANVIERRALPYVANIDYKCPHARYIPFNVTAFNVNNTYDNFLTGKINPYIYPYEDKTDVYLSDCGIYFPSQYQDKLVKAYSYIPTFMALSRQLGGCNVHTNSQFLGRTWDKLREQSDCYIVAKGCNVIGKLVLQTIYVYERYQSACDNVPIFKYKPNLFMNTQTRTQIELAKRNYVITYGEIKEYTLVYINKSNYDTRAFKTLLGGKNEK